MKYLTNNYDTLDSPVKKIILWIYDNDEYTFKVDPQIHNT